MSDWTRPSRRVGGYPTAGYGIMVPRYDRRRVEAVLGLIARALQADAGQRGVADLTRVISEVVTPLRAKEDLPKDTTFSHRMRAHPVYAVLREQKKVRIGGK